MDELELARQEIDRADAELAAAFVRRMEAASRIARYKIEQGLPVFDPAREARVLEQNAGRVASPPLREAYLRLLKCAMSLSRAYQRRLGAENDGALWVESERGGYGVTVARGALARAGELFDLDRRVLVVTDRGVPPAYAAGLAELCREPVMVTLDEGAAGKSLCGAERLWSVMLEHGFTRADCVCAMGGGSVGDAAGFAAACWMRGVDFYNVPTTLLAQADASIGGKTGLDQNGVKNLVGAFWPPKAVLIDPDLLKILPPRLLAEGMAEIVKMAVVSDGALLAEIEAGDPYEKIETLLLRALKIKRALVEADERDEGSRRLLNFGHTVGHGVEALAGGALYHGECVALGMLPMCTPALRARLIPLLQRLGLPTRCALEPERILAAALHDKKRTAQGIMAVFADEEGAGYCREISPDELKARIETGWNR